MICPDCNTRFDGLSCPACANRRFALGQHAFQLEFVKQAAEGARQLTSAKIRYGPPVTHIRKFGSLATFCMKMARARNSDIGKLAWADIDKPGICPSCKEIVRELEREAVPRAAMR